MTKAEWIAIFIFIIIVIAIIIIVIIFNRKRIFGGDGGNPLGPPTSNIPSGPSNGNIPSGPSTGNVPSVPSDNTGDGSSCNNNLDCKGWIAGKAGTPGCCNGKCTTLLKDWANVGYCPDVCQDAPSPLGKAGTCSSGYTWPRSEGQPCDSHSACKGWVAGKAGTLGCCNGTCTTLLKDWTGVGYCPDVCQDAPSPLGKPGTCSSGYTWLRSQGQPCDTHAACQGWVAAQAGTLACCNGTCTPLKRDWAGIGYCPDDCVGCFGCGRGTC